MTFNEWNAAQQKECGVMPIGIQAPTGSGVKAMQAQVNRVAESIITDYRTQINNVNNTLTQKDVEFRQIIDSIIERLNNASSGTTKEQIREAIMEILNDATFKLPELSLALCGGKYKLTDALGAIANANYVKSFEFSKNEVDRLPAHLNITMATGETYSFNSGAESRVQLTDDNSQPTSSYLIGYEASNFPYGRGGVYFLYDREMLTFTGLGEGQTIQEYYWHFRGGSPYLYINYLSDVSPVTELTDGTVQVTFNPTSSNTTTTTTETTNNGGSTTSETTSGGSNTSDTSGGSSATETSGDSGVSEGL